MVRERKEYNKGDIVYLIKRKSTGYPRHIKENVPYYIFGVEGNYDVLIVKKQNTDGSPLKVHCSYMSDLSYIRNKKIEELLNDL